MEGWIEPRSRELGKLVTRVLAQRAQGVLSTVVHPAQTCSVPGRTRYDLLSGLRDILSYVRSRVPNGCLLSLDQAKACDSVVHSYLFNGLEVYGFPAWLTNTIRRLSGHHRSSLLLLRRTSLQFLVCRGVRQG